MLSSNTKIINIPNNLDIRGSIYDIYGNNIDIRGSLIKRDTQIYFPLDIKVYNENTKWAFDKYKLYNDVVNARNVGIDTAILCLHVVYSNNKLSLSSNHGDINFVIDEIIKNGMKYSIYGVKFHQDFSDWDNSMPLYNDFIINIITKLNSAGIKFNTVFICNEKIAISSNTNYSKYLIDTANSLKSLGYNVSSSAIGIGELYNYNKDLFNSIKPAMNFYPTISFLDDKAYYRKDMAENIIEMFNLNVPMIENNQLPTDNGITESGIMPRSKALRSPSSFQDNGEDFDNAVIIYWKVLKDISKILKPPFICVWFIEFFDRDYKNELYNIFKTI